MVSPESPERSEVSPHTAVVLFRTGQFGASFALLSTLLPLGVTALWLWMRSSSPGLREPSTQDQAERF